MRVNNFPPIFALFNNSETKHTCGWHHKLTMGFCCSLGCKSLGVDIPPLARVVAVVTKVDADEVSHCRKRGEFNAGNVDQKGLDQRSYCDSVM